MHKKLLEIASDIVQTQVSLSPMTGAEIALSLRQVYSTLRELQGAETTGTDLPSSSVAAPLSEAKPAEKPALTPENSIRDDKVICLECGAEFKQLTKNHLTSHDLNPKEYKKKYGLSMKTPLSARSLTKARSKAAKKRGLPEKLKTFIEARRQEKAAAGIQSATETVTASKPKRTRTRKKAGGLIR